MNWFERLVGFREENPAQVRHNLRVEEDRLESLVNGNSFRCGTLKTPSLERLRNQTSDLLAKGGGSISFSEIVENVQELHRATECNGALFQVASQFNLLEMVGPSVPPEHGVGIYEYDATQGPACAIACGAATIYRNYFAEVDGEIGQAEARQLDCLEDLGGALGNGDRSLWEMRNGYALATAGGLQMIAALLASGGEVVRDRLRSKLRVGVQWQAGVTLGRSENVVSQAFCSALPVAYSEHGTTAWEPFAELILEAAYEATLHAAVLNRRLTGSNQVYLTLLGGGAFGNQTSWIVAAIERALELMVDSGLDVKLVSYGGRTPEIAHLLDG